MSVPKNHGEARAKNAHGQDLLDTVQRGKSAAARLTPDANDARYREKTRSGGIGSNVFDQRSSGRKTST